MGTVVEKYWLFSGTAIIWSPKPISVNWNERQSRSLSNWSVMTTCWTGAVAFVSFSKSMRYGSKLSGITNAFVPKPAGPILSFGSNDLAMEVALVTVLTGCTGTNGTDDITIGVPKLGGAE